MSMDQLVALYRAACLVIHVQRPVYYVESGFNQGLLGTDIVWVNYHVSRPAVMQIIKAYCKNAFWTLDKRSLDFFLVS